MTKSLGILVCSDRHFEDVLGICLAASKREVRVRIFLTHLGLRLTGHPDFEELKRNAEITLCKEGLKSTVPEPQTLGLEQRSYSTQASNAELIHSCDRYLVF